MGMNDYQKALKLGDKEYRACVGKGLHPYLPVLDELVSRVDIEAQVPLGLVEIPIKSIVGTYSAGRTTAFARNFMPILDTDSEFAMKWAQLYDELEADGLRDPVKAYEFNNRFYIMEGNKRVSVFKYMDAVSIEGNVTRMIPKRSDEPSVKIYYEFMDFYELTGINYLYMSREGNFKKLLMYTSDGETKWTKEQEQDFRALYTFFENEFLPRAKDKLTITCGDALCVYLSIYGYREALEKTQNEIRLDLARLWNEFVNYNNGSEMTMILNPTPESRKTALSKLIPMGSSPLKVVFVHDRSASRSSWTYAHELGRKYVQDTLGDKIQASAVERVDNEDADDILDAAIEAGNRVVFTTSPKLMPATLRAAAKHPDITFLNCSMNLGHQTIRSYYLRIYEAKFILGAIAGAMQSEGNIGYLADYPINGATADINAFAMGVQMTRPGARVFLEWSMVKDHDPFDAFREHNVRLISARDINATASAGREFGLYALRDGEESHLNLAMPVGHWGKLYEEILRSILRGAYKNDENVFADQALNYFWGMSSDAVDVIYSRNLPAGPIRLLRNLRSGIRNMDINPLTGPVYAQDGSLKCEDGQTISAKDAVHLNWLCENIEGNIPKISELREEALELVRIQGLDNGE